MALREARVSLAWIRRVSQGMSGEIVKRLAEGGFGVIFFTMKLLHCSRSCLPLLSNRIGGSCTRVDRPEV
jgi:hypothetical protein